MASTQFSGSLKIGFSAVLLCVTACNKSISNQDSAIQISTTLDYSIIGSEWPISSEVYPVSESEFGRLSALEVDEEGFLYILDDLNNAISIASPNGESASSLVFDAGEGPGEFQRVSDLSVVNSTIYILDGRLGRVVVYSRTLDFLYQFQVTGRPTRILSDGSHLFLTKFSPSNQGDIIHRYSFEGDEMGSFLPKPANWQEIAMTGNFGQLAKDDLGQIYYSYPTPYVIFKLSNTGTVLDSLVFDETVQVEGEKSPTGAVVATQTLRGIAVHPKGYVFNVVRTQTDATIDIFDQEFNYISSLDSTSLGLVDFNLIKIDPSGALYLGTNSPVPHVRKYTISISK